MKATSRRFPNLYLMLMLTGLSLMIRSTQLAHAQADSFTAVAAEVHFDKPLRVWDGFGVNYVEVAQSIDYDQAPQEYGGLSLLDESERQRVIDLVFGDDGLRPALVKMFLDPWHQAEPDGPFDHRRSTRWMRYFAAEGLKRTRARGDELAVITTLYGPPAWATKQKFLRGRDLDVKRRRDLAEYMIDWVSFLRKEEIPVKYISLHNEGEDWRRWPADGASANIGKGHDYNLFWPSEQVVDFLQFMPPMLAEPGLDGVYVTCGENTNWYRFVAWGYADAIAEDPAALENLGLIKNILRYRAPARSATTFIQQP